LPIPSYRNINLGFTHYMINGLQANCRWTIQTNMNRLKLHYRQNPINNARSTSVHARLLQVHMKNYQTTV
jgi:hypothetical protein